MILRLCVPFQAQPEALISSDFVKVNNEGIVVALRKGKSSTLVYENPRTKEKFRVLYNTNTLSGTINQKPDNILSIDKGKNTMTYELKLPTDHLFAKVHGDVTLHYTVYGDSKIVLLTNITPDSILEEGHRSELGTYKGVMISKTNKEKDMFKVNLLNALNNK